MMAVLAFLAGVTLVLAALWDVFRSLVRSPLRAGPFTTAAEFAICRGLLRLFHLTGRRAFLGAIGPVSVPARALAVVAALIAGWALVLQGAEGWILISSSNAPAGPWERLYLAAYAVATLGFGAYEPDSPAARLLTAGASLTGFIVLTFSVGAVSTISQVLAARDAVVATMRAHAAALAAGADPEAALDRTLDFVASPLSAVASAIRTLPVLHRLHGETESQAFSVALDRLDQALPTNPADPRAQMAAQAMDEVLEVLSRGWLGRWLEGPDTDRRARIAAFLRADRLTPRPDP
jgi:hypothetical protein